MASLLPKGVDRPQPQRRPYSSVAHPACRATTSTDAGLRQAAPSESAPPPPWHRLISTALIDTMPTKITRPSPPRASGILALGIFERPPITCVV
eukprot:scaffold27100_cov69-Phaeocystis_antarctica.AAC.1